MDAQTIVDLCKKHSLYSWSATGKVDPLAVTRAEGIYFWTADGQRMVDFNSQLMCVNIGHNHPKVVARMKEALDRVIFIYPGAATEVRARLSERLAKLMPGDLNAFFYTLGGAEANENAIKAARLYTGRHKILARYRSYHGASAGAMQLTGDPRRLPNEPGIPGVVHVMDPNPYDYSFGATDAERADNNLRYLEEVIHYEGPSSIAAMFVETVTGTNGVLSPPADYLPRLRQLLDKYGILLVCDEVMAGFGRTGKMFAFEHWGVIPDIVTMAKGLTSAYAPLGCMAVRQPIADHFQDNVFWGGLTYNAHPFCLETAMAVLDVMDEEDVLGNTVRMGAVMRQEMDRLQAKHPSVKEGRCIGLFGMMDLQKNSKGEGFAPYNGAHPVLGKLGAFFKKEGLFTFIRWNSFTCNPPLTITEAQLRESFEIVDRGLELVDEAFEG